jgi:hydroxymethylglutaryl-CoA lyase
MGFGNPYGDPWNADIVMKWVEKMISMKIEIISLADTIGVADPDSIALLFKNLVPAFPRLSSVRTFIQRLITWREKIDAAFENGCRRFDGAIKGYGGCPMAKDELTGNMPTENLLEYFKEKKTETAIDTAAFAKAMNIALSTFQ